MERFRDKVALVTGASSGIGRATAARFGVEGARIVLNHHGQAEDAESVAETIRRTGGNPLVVEADVADGEAVAAMVHRVEDEVGEIDILVNNAGIASHVPFTELSEAEWDLVHAVNLKGVFNCCRAVVPTMVRRGRGKIINVASELGLVGAETLVHYCSSKGAVIAMSKALARELGPRGINVNAVAPGPTETPMLTSYPKEYNERTRLQIPLRRWGRPEDIAATICFLASEDASFYAGSVLSPNGGVVM